MKSVELARVNCPVCGQGFSSAPWSCKRCETPHHPECAAYFGGCAIFGCRDGDRPDPLERSTWPAAYQMLRKGARMRYLASVSSVLFTASTSFLALCLVIKWVIGAPLTGVMSIVTVLFITSILALGLQNYTQSALGPAFWRGYFRELEAGLGSQHEIPFSRLGEDLTPLLPEQTRFAWLNRLGWFSMIFGVLLAFSSPWFAVLLPLGMVLNSASHELEGAAAEVQVCMNRFQATFAPPVLEKGDEPGTPPAIEPPGTPSPGA